MDLRIRTKPFSMVPNVLMFALSQMDLSKTEAGIMFAAIPFVHYGRGGEDKTRLDCKKALFAKNQRTVRGNVYRALKKLVERGILNETVKARFHINQDLAEWRDPDGSLVFYIGSIAHERLVNLFQAQPWNGVQRIDPLADGKYRSTEADFDQDYDQDLADQYDEDGLTPHQERFNSTPDDGLTRHQERFNLTPEKVSPDTQYGADRCQRTPVKVSPDTRLDPQTRTVKLFGGSLNKQSCLRSLETTTSADLTFYVQSYVLKTAKDMKELENVMRYAPDNLQHIYDFFGHLAALADTKKFPDSIVKWSRWYFSLDYKPSYPRQRGVPTFEEFQTKLKDQREIELQGRLKTQNISTSDDQRSREGTYSVENASSGPSSDSWKPLAADFIARSHSEQLKACEWHKKYRNFGESDAIESWIEQGRPAASTDNFLFPHFRIGRAEMLYSNYLTALELQEAAQ